MTEPIRSEASSNPLFDELEELSEALEAPKLPEPLASDDILETPEGTLQVRRFLGRQASINLYDARFQQDQDALLREAEVGACADRLRREFELLCSVSCPMLPRSLAHLEKNGRFYFATETITGSSLAEALASESLGPLQFLTALAQVAFAASQLHAQGWAHLAIRPATVVLGKPIRLTDLAHATRLGQRPPAPFYYSGYSAPELLAEVPIDARADVYSIGALLFHAVSGYPIPESGAVLTGWTPKLSIPGVPQILHKCLGPVDTRYAAVVELHQDLLRLLRRCGPRIRHEHAFATTIGLDPTRTANEDACGTISRQVSSEESSQEWSLVAVADGMGGMDAGEVASAVAVETVLAEFMTALNGGGITRPEEQTNLVIELVKKANSKVYDALNARQAKGGCTLVCALLIDSRLAIAHVGDCRVYLVRGREMRLLTRDHSVAMSLVMQGEIDISQLRTYPDRSNITRSLGDRPTLPAHYVDTLVHTTGKEVMDLRAGDTLLLCTDGFWEPVIEDSAAETISEAGGDLDDAATRLLDSVIKNGAPDNATVSLLRIHKVAQFPQRV